MPALHPLAGPIADAMRDAALTLGCHPTLGEVAEVSGFTCIDAGLGVSPANVAIPRDLQGPALPALRAAAEWFTARGLNFRVDIPGDAPSDLMAAAMTLGLRFWERQPVMLLDAIWPQPLPGELDIRTVESDEDVEAFAAVDAAEHAGEPLPAGIIAAARDNPRCGSSSAAPGPSASPASRSCSTAASRRSTASTSTPPSAAAALAPK
ncbi:hypothetical protein O0235_00395 [Tepidiforma flava]|uniref:Uncharacterized protein n=1 Tax=Tepidiforma flava TaxID=3004094 RepID=A0ABY7M6T4_9CHLR|nr:hypothetical protein [Tepidiforma flava]WBL36120.1 hypothetical protein O0235_00395 [Tepidiforma flava]